MDELIIDNKKYFSVKKAAELRSYTNDYIGQLCRSGKLVATRVGRSWYIEENSLLNHGNEIDAEPGPTRKDRVYYPPRMFSQSPSIFKNSIVVYKSDESPLFPELVIAEEVDGTETLDIPDEDMLVAINLDDTEEISTHSYFDWFKVWKVTVVSSVFIFIFIFSFSLNGTYTATVISNELSDMKAFALATPAGKTISQEIIRPYALVAKTINDSIDNAVYNFLYEDVVK